MRFILCFLILFSFSYSSAPKEILLLHSYNKGLKWTDGISEGVENVLKNYSDYELTTEYMDSKKIDTKEYFEVLLSLYEKKFSKRDYKIVIAADNYAFKFALENHKRLFKEVPIVFCGVENFDKKDIPLNLQKFVTGVVEYKVIDKNIQLAKKIIPNLNTLYIISDNSYSSLAIKKQILQSSKPYEKEFNIIYDNDILMDKLIQELNKLPKNSAILFTSLYKDKNGRYIPYNELREFFKSSKLPIFALNKIHLFEGILGGVMINPIEQGVKAGEQAIEILSGKSPLQIDIKKPLAQTYFDYKVLEKFQISNHLIPLGSVVVNKPKSFFEKNRKLVDSAFIMMPILIILIIGLIINISKKITLEVKLTEQTRLDNVLLNNISSAVFWKSKDGILLGCNDSFCNFFGVKKEDAIGKKIDDIIPEVCNIFNDKKEFIDEMETKLYNTSNNEMDVFIKRNQYLNKNNEKAGVVTVISDITDIKKLQLQRKKEEQFLIQRSKLSEIGEMIASIAHQWKTPLVDISSIAQELLYKRKKQQITQEDTKEFVDDIMMQVQYMTNTIDDFRSFIKPSNSKNIFDIEEALQELLKIIEHNIKFNYITIKINTEKNQNFTVYGYPNEFKQSILNIINNAKESILKRKEKEKIEGIIDINIFHKGDDIYLKISDNGIGIEKNKIEKIFEPFYTSKKDGDGFGLYMAKLIIEDKMNGSIKAEPIEQGLSILVGLKQGKNI